MELPSRTLILYDQVCTCLPIRTFGSGKPFQISSENIKITDSSVISDTVFTSINARLLLVYGEIDGTTVTGVL
jgi:hypothetical protein